MLFGMVRHKKTVFLLALFFILGTVSLMTGCAAEPQEDTYFGYPLETLMENKTPYVGNNSKVGGLIHAMPFPSAFAVESFELHTARQPYRITLNLKKMGDPISFDDAEIKEAFYRNSVVLFCLIGNVDGINFNITDTDGQKDIYSFNREKVEKRLMQELRPYGESTDTLKNLINELMGS